MTGASQQLRYALVGAVAVATTAFAAVQSNGSFGATLAAPVALFVVTALVLAPLEWSAAGLLTIALLFHNPGARPMADAWRGPLAPLGEIIFNNLRLVVGIDFLRFCVLEALIVIVTLVACARALGPQTRPRIRAGALPTYAVALVGFASLAVMCAWGLAHGGDFRQLLWQTRQLGWIPLLTVIFIAALTRPGALRTFGVVVVGVALLRALEGAYFYFAIVLPQNLAVPYLITHEDSVLFTVTLVLLGMRVLEEPRRGPLARAVALGAPIVFALLMNQRRLAYVGLFGCVAAGLLMARPSLRRALLHLALVASPLLVTYVAVGWGSHSKLFAPIQALRSVEDDDNASNQTRDVENDNLIATLRASPIVGSGFGHAYQEVTRTFSIERYMENYRYIAHNSVLGLWSLTGLLGFCLLTLPLAVTVFLATRAYGRARDARERVAAVACVAVVIAYWVQAYGDMGAQGWMGAMLLALGHAVAARLALVTSAWPSATPGTERMV